MDDQRPSDFMPYVMGYMRAISGHSNDATTDYAPEYTQGFERGSLVREGKALPPSWIETKRTGAVAVATVRIGSK